MRQCAAMRERMSGGSRSSGSWLMIAEPHALELRRAGDEAQGRFHEKRYNEDDGAHEVELRDSRGPAKCHYACAKR